MEVPGVKEVHIDPGGEAYLDFTVSELGDGYNIAVTVNQSSNVLLYVGIDIVDHDNFLRWHTIREGGRAGANLSLLPGVSSAAASYLGWGTLSFWPEAKGEWYVTLENDNQPPKPIDVTVVLTATSTEPLFHGATRQAMLEMRWEDIWDKFQSGDTLLAEGKLPQACSAVRMAYVSLWKRVAERLANEHINFQPGKSTDVSVLKKALEPYAPSFMLSLLTPTWSLISELTHTEKRDGEEPTIEQVLMSIRHVYACSAYLSSLLKQLEHR